MARLGIQDLTVMIPLFFLCLFFLCCHMICTLVYRLFVDYLFHSSLSTEVTKPHDSMSPSAAPSTYSPTPVSTSGAHCKLCVGSTVFFSHDEATCSTHDENTYIISQQDVHPTCFLTPQTVPCLSFHEEGSITPRGFIQSYRGLRWTFTMKGMVSWQNMPCYLCAYRKWYTP
jgi:hypothetical protein